MAKILLQLCMAFWGSAGFSLLFHQKKNGFFPASLGGMITWGVYLLAIHLNGNEFWSCLIASVFAAILGEILARILKSPSSSFFIVIVIPLIPGSNLYYSLFYTVANDPVLARENVIMTAVYAVSIALGLAIVSTLLFMWRQLKKTMLKSAHSQTP